MRWISWVVLLAMTTACSGAVPTAPAETPAVASSNALPDPTPRVDPGEPPVFLSVAYSFGRTMTQQVEAGHPYDVFFDGDWAGCGPWVLELTHPR